MTAKTKLIPFDWELYRKGAKAVFRTIPNEILRIFNSVRQESYPLIAISWDGKESLTSNCKLDGKNAFNINYDLMLEVELEEKTFWINVNPESMASTLWEREEDADNYKSPRRLGKIKVTYTEEDLIK